jgi:hypothetical protein
MARTASRAELRAEFYRHNTLWTAAHVLRNFGATPDGGLFGRLAALLFCYLAFEGMLNHLGEALFPADWARERDLFTRPPFKGTLGKLSFLASKCGLTLAKGRRPFYTLKLLDTRRSLLVHPRTERRRRTISFLDPRQLPRELASELDDWTTDRAIARAFEDVERMSADLVAAARSAFPAKMHHVYGAGFSGAVGTQEGRIL